MLPIDVVRRGQHMLTVCNACRYCEQYCPVFPALEKRRTFEAADLEYLANLCHNCGECLYACQFAPPHEFGVNVPMMLAEVRLHSYKEHAWPPAFGEAFRRHSFRTGLAALALVVSVLVIASIANRGAMWSSDGSADFYGVISHGAMVTLFGAVSLFVLIAMGVSAVRFWRGSGAGQVTLRASALRDAMTLRHLHGRGRDCVSNLEVRQPWRRWFHHCTFYGFLLCFASTIGRGDLPQRIWMACPVRVLEPSGIARRCRRLRPAHRTAGARGPRANARSGPWSRRVRAASIRCSLHCCS